MPAAAFAHGAMRRAAYYDDFITMPVLAFALIVLGGASLAEAKPRSPCRAVSLPMYVEGFGWVRVTAPCVRRGR